MIYSGLVFVKFKVCGKQIFGRKVAFFNRFGITVLNLISTGQLGLLNGKINTLQYFFQGLIILHNSKADTDSNTELVVLKLENMFRNSVTYAFSGNIGTMQLYLRQNNKKLIAIITGS